jgi:hypothetical protein
MRAGVRSSRTPGIELHDIEKLYGHPSIKGMSAIASQALKV